MFKYICLITIVYQLAQTSSSEIEWKVERRGNFGFYEEKGDGACGYPIDAAREYLVAIGREWFTSSNLKNDTYCTSKACVEIENNGKSIMLAILDLCPTCTKNDLELSKKAFAKLADLTEVRVQNAKWFFVPC